MKRILLVALAAVAVVGCKKTDMIGTGSDSGVVQFKASTTSLTRTSTVGTESSWVKGDQIGIYMEGDDYGYNVAYEAASSGSETTFSLVAGESALEYPNSGTADFYAYYPYQSYLTEGKTDDDNGFTARDTYLADLTDQSDLGAIDFMVASATSRSASNEGEGVDLLFEHRLSKVELTINTMETLDDLNGLVVTISGPGSKAEYSYNGDLIGFTSVGDVIEFCPVKKTTVDGKVTEFEVAAILNPETLVCPVLSFSIGSTSHSVDITSITETDEFEIQQGMIHTFTLYLGEDMVKFTDCSIEPWEDGETTTSTDYAERIGDGSLENPFYVYDAADLAMIGTSEEEYVKEGIGNKGGVWSLDAHYKMMNNIDLEGSVDNEWTPIGTSSSSTFTGSFDGDSKVISGLYIASDYDGSQSDSKYDNKGLFGYVENGTISNLGVVDCYVYGRRSIGGVVGYIDGTVKNCYVSGTVKGGGYYIGGVVGGNSDSDYCLVSECYNLANVEATGSQVGGVIGYHNKAHVINCYNLGDVSSSSSHVGGICGQCDNDTYVIGCYNEGDISGSSKVGGITGNYNARTNISACFNSGNVSLVDPEGIAFQGAIAGFRETWTALTMHDCYYLSESVKDGVTGRSNNNTIADEKAACHAISYDEMLANGEIVMQKLNNAIITYNETAETGREACAWVYDISKSIYPGLDLAATPTTTDFGDGLSADTPEQLYFVTDFSPRGVASTNSNITTSYSADEYHYKMMADIDLEGDADNQWAMISELTGSFDGNGYKLSGVYMEDQFAIPIGRNYGTIKNLTIDGYFSGEYAAGLVYDNQGIINGCCNMAAVDADGYAVGLVFTNTSGATIYNSYNSVAISSSTIAAGLVYDNYGTIEGCGNEGTVEAEGYATGLVHINNTGATIINSYNTGVISGIEASYGVVHSNSGRTTNSYSIGVMVFYTNSDGSVENCYHLIDATSSSYTWYQTAGYSAGITDVNKLLNDRLNSYRPEDGWLWEISSETYPTLMFETFEVESDND